MNSVIIRSLGLRDYGEMWEAMKAFTDSRNESTLDELWLTQHPAVYTQGQAGKTEHLLNPGTIPIQKIDRGGQVTYHGPGQLIAYTLFDLRRLNLSPRQLVNRIENTTIALLAQLDIQARSKPEAPGIYVEKAKIGSIGLRIRKGCSYHGLALNVDMDLEPFKRINPCGCRGLEMTQIKDLSPEVHYSEIEDAIIPYFLENFGYNQHQFLTTL